MWPDPFIFFGEYKEIDDIHISIKKNIELLAASFFMSIILRYTTIYLFIIEENNP